MKISLLIVFLLVYIIAAIPSGYWMGLAFSKNLLEEGSKSTGATNVLRVVGKWQAIVVLIFDLLKGFLPIFYIKNYFPLYAEMNQWIFLALIFLPILAHSKSVFIAFKGGKSSATGLGVLFALDPLVALITLVIWIAVVAFTKISSLGSIIAVPLVPIWLWYFGDDAPTISFGVVAFIYIVLIKHRANILRLIKGEENSF